MQKNCLILWERQGITGKKNTLLIHPTVYSPPGPLLSPMLPQPLPCGSDNNCLKYVYFYYLNTKKHKLGCGISGILSSKNFYASLRVQYYTTGWVTKVTHIPYIVSFMTFGLLGYYFYIPLGYSSNLFSYNVIFVFFVLHAFY
jgi:hypothetical protein